jgi:4'-phosphopantetheinyl transferase
MPLHQLTHLTPTTVLGLWHVQETAEELQAHLHALRPGHEIPVFKSESRTREWLGARLLAYTLLEKLSAPPLLLHRKETGMPVCSEAGWHVSLTHSGPWVGALVSCSDQVGIDIELRHEKILRLAPRFLNEPELQAADGDLEKVLLYWSAKETLYKVYQQKELIFKEQLLVSDFERQPAGFFEGQVLTDTFHQRYAVHYAVYPDFVLTYVLAPLA